MSSRPSTLIDSAAFRRRMRSVHALWAAHGEAWRSFQQQREREVLAVDALPFDLAGTALPLVDRVALGRRLDQIPLTGFLDRFADLIDLLENGGSRAAVIGEARQLHCDIAEHLGVTVHGYALGADVCGDGHTQGDEPRLDRAEADVSVKERSAVLFGKRHGFSRVGRLTGWVRKTLSRVLNGDQP